MADVAPLPGSRALDLPLDVEQCTDPLERFPTHKVDGWIHLVNGALTLAAGVGILSGRSWALVAGLGLAVISALSQFMFMPFYPFWALLLLAPPEGSTGPDGALASPVDD